MATQKQFRDFLSDIEPSSTTKSRASSAHTELRDHLKTDDGFSAFYIKTYLSGSYKRDTAIRPKIKDGKESRPDVDIIVLTNHGLHDDPVEVIDQLFSSLQKLKNDKRHYLKIRRQSRSVGLITTTVDMDVVPIIAPDGAGGTLYVADRKAQTWIETNPPAHTDWTVEQNSNSGGRFKPSVKLAKWWRRENPTVGKKPKGFVIECIIAECMDRKEKQWGELFVSMLETIVTKYESSVVSGIAPWITDPGVNTNSVTSGMTFESFEGFYNKVKAHAELGREALEEEDDDKALEKWRKIFGSRFPKKAQSTTKSLLASAAPTTAGLSFPDKPAVPKKPTGFA